MDSNVGWAKLTYLIETYRIDYIAHPTGLIIALDEFETLESLIEEKKISKEFMET